jgi:hypothetical protein
MSNCTIKSLLIIVSFSVSSSSEQGRATSADAWPLLYGQLWLLQEEILAIPLSVLLSHLIVLVCEMHLVRHLE